MACIAQAKETLPLPDDVEIIPPAAGSPENLAAFSGTWEGYWGDSRRPALLIVEYIDNEEAELIYSWGDCFKCKTGEGFLRITAKVLFSDSKITVTWGDGTKSAKFNFTLKDAKDDKISGNWEMGGKEDTVKMKKVINNQNMFSVKINQTAEIVNLPLPNDVKIIPPATDLSPEIAAFSGTWKGYWSGELAAELIVERISSAEAQIIYSWGNSYKYGVTRGFDRETVKVVVSGSKVIIQSGDGIVYPKTIFTLKNGKAVYGIYEFHGIQNGMKMKKVQ
jgi:hypothetical protein